MQAHQILLRADGGLGNLRPLLHTLELFLLLRGNRGDGAVIQSVKIRDSGGDIRQDALLLHALAHHAAHELREQHSGFRGPEEFLHPVAARALDLDVKALELTLEGVQSLQRGALIALAGIKGLQRLGKAAAALTVHSLFQLQIFVMICHLSSPPYSTMVTVLAAVSASTAR